jgi:NAD-dependent dihydropyrimidine dehydrogenase PreA subunit
MDGITGMDGNGPMNGDPIQMNVLLFSDDPIALDAAVCRMIDLNPEYSFTITEGERAGLGSYHGIELVGDPVGSFLTPQFHVNREPVSDSAPLRPGRGSRQHFMPKPYIVPELCKKCGVCVQMCPVERKAVNWRDGDKTAVPSYDYDICIRCFCCQELCPEGAIKIR